MHTEIKRDLEKQKSAIEARGQLTQRGLELNIETWVVTRNDRWYSSGAFGFTDPDEMTKREAEALAFKTGAKAVSAKVFWDKKYKFILDAISRL
jgi:hypothetical protein